MSLSWELFKWLIGSLGFGTEDNTWSIYRLYHNIAEDTLEKKCMKKEYSPEVWALCTTVFGDQDDEKKLA